MSSYTDRYLRDNSAGKPACFGEVSKYSTEDSECRVCNFKGSCRILVDRKIDNADIANRRLYNGQAVRPGYTHPVVTPVAPTQASPPLPAQRMAATGAETFFEILLYNGTLSALEAVMHEGVFAVRSIPRRNYPIPLWARKDK